ncbi:hypothetical protein [Bacillus sp. 37MA]|nr:hypothetical protein [Bacillus sp. 37MA]
MIENFEIAQLSSEQTERIQQLESELECTLIAYERKNERSTQSITSGA